MELPTSSCQVVTRTDASSPISSASHSNGNVETNLERTGVERSGGKKARISVWVKICLRNSTPRNMKAKGECLGIQRETFSVP